MVLRQDLSSYGGKWIAIIDKHVAASNKNFNKLMEDVKKKYPKKRPLVAKIRNKLSLRKLMNLNFSLRIDNITNLCFYRR